MFVQHQISTSLVKIVGVKIQVFWDKLYQRSVFDHSDGKNSKCDCAMFFMGSKVPCVIVQQVLFGSKFEFSGCNRRTLKAIVQFFLWGGKNEFSGGKCTKVHWFLGSDLEFSVVKCTEGYSLRCFLGSKLGSSGGKCTKCYIGAFGLGIWFFWWKMHQTLSSWCFLGS